MKLFFLSLLFSFSALTALATRTISISAPASVVTGSSFTVPTSAYTDVGGGEQIGFYHAEYSTDGGSSWTGFCYDVNVGSSATRTASITAGAAGSTIKVRVRIAFRGGSLGDVDYNGNAIDWGGSWDGWGSPPAQYATISVTAPPNSAPTITWVQTASSAYINSWFTIQARGNDVDGNLMNVLVWKDWVPFAFNGGGNGYENYSDANGTYGSTPGTITFEAQANDLDNAASPVIYDAVTIVNRNPSVSMQLLDGSKNALPINGSGRAQIAINSNFYIRVTGTDPDANLANLYSRINTPDNSAFAYETATASGGSSTHDFGPYNTGASAGIWNAWAHATDTTATDYYWQGNGWWGIDTPDLEVVNQAPVIASFTLDGAWANKTSAFGQTVSIASTMTDADGNLAAHTFWWDQGNGSAWTNPWNPWDYPANATGWSSASSTSMASTGGASSTKSAAFTASHAGTYQFLTGGYDTSNSWATTLLTLTVNKATPASAFVARTVSTTTSTYTVQASDLNAVFVNPYTASVTAPTGAVTYSLVGPNTAVSVGTNLAAPGTYTVRATYAGDGNYNAATVDAVWTVSNDGDGDGIPGVIETQLETNPSVNNVQADSGNAQNQLKITKPQ